MGCFSSTNIKGPLIKSDKLFQYSRNAKVSIKIRNVTGAVIGSQTISFKTTEPVLISSKEISLLNEKVQISSCIMPGIDPRGEYNKKCQDNCFFLSDSECILCCLFDGHGGEGEKVAEFCQRIIENIFNAQRKFLHVKFI